MLVLWAGDRSLHGRLSLSLRVQVGKPRNTPCSCFLHTALCCSELTTGLFRTARSTLLTLMTNPQSTRSARNVCSLIFLYDSTYVRVCQAVEVRFSVLNSFGARFRIYCIKLMGQCRRGLGAIGKPPKTKNDFVSQSAFLQAD